MDRDFISWAEKQLGGSTVVDKEPHGDQSTVYRLAVPSGNYFLKIAPALEKERERLEWLGGKLPVPKVIGFTRIGDKGALLLSAVEGIDLAKLCKKWPAQKIVSKWAEALRRFHAVNIKDCPFGDPGSEKLLVHGDACLPNFIFKNDNFSGYIDLGDVRIDAPEIDLSAAVWSLQYNLGKGYGRKFLQEYGLKNATDELAEKLRLQYEKVQKEWGLI
jgi:kanamycin kinase/aminoglycoside 3'-phosphotransferase-2